MVLNPISLSLVGDFIKEDLLEAASAFFKGVELSRYFTTSFIVLIPKVKTSTSFEKFRPISLYLVALKIFSKMILSWLSSYLRHLILEE